MMSLRPAGMELLSEAPPVDRGPAKYHMPTDEERAAGRELSDKERTDRFFNKMQTLKEEKSPEEIAQEKRKKDADAGWATTDEEWQ